jgi:soluble lytic murein transglycosylase-like protein
MAPLREDKRSSPPFSGDGLSGRPFTTGRRATMKTNTLRDVLAAAAGFATAAAVLFASADQPLPVRPQNEPALTEAAVPEPLVELPVQPEPPPAQPSSETPTLGEAAQARIERRVSALAQEMGRMWTRNPGELVSVIESASRTEPGSQRVTLLLAIAHAETHGKILEVSEAGAAGLAQATPVAYLQEALPGRLFITEEYVNASRAYIVKKPLGDADKVASIALNAKSQKDRDRARTLLEAAKQLRREGFEELDFLRPFGPAGYSESIERADTHNEAVLNELSRLMERNDRDGLKRLQTRVRQEYSALRKAQAAGWKQYQNDLISARDRMISRQFGDPAAAKRERPYEVAEYLGEHLDARFSAEGMARFLVRHLDRKAGEAQLLTSADNIEAMTAALYNGGSHNVKRMLAGLISRLPETENYMKKVPETRRRLDAQVAKVDPSFILEDRTLVLGK